MVVHCAAGKDRTGVVCAVALSLLGVSDDDIAADYALSTQASEQLTAWMRQTYPDRDALPQTFLESPVEAMLLFLAELRELHGSVERYALDAGVSAAQINALRTHLLT